MTEKQKVFANEYLIDLNATRAYRAAYPSVRNNETAAAAAVRLLKNVNVAEYIRKRMQERQKRTEVTQDRVLKELGAIAFANAGDYWEIKDGQLTVRNTEELTEQQLRAVAEIRESRNGIEIRLNDKGKALELLGRHLGMYQDKVEISGVEEEQKKLDDILRQVRGDSS